MDEISPKEAFRHMMLWALSLAKRERNEDDESDHINRQLGIENNRLSAANTAMKAKNRTSA